LYGPLTFLAGAATLEPIEVPSCASIAIIAIIMPSPGPVVQWERKPSARRFDEPFANPPA